MRPNVVPLSGSTPINGTGMNGAVADRTTSTVPWGCKGGGGSGPGAGASTAAGRPRPEPPTSIRQHRGEQQQAGRRSHPGNRATPANSCSLSVGIALRRQGLKLRQHFMRGAHHVSGKIDLDPGSSGHIGDFKGLLPSRSRSRTASSCGKCPQSRQHSPPSAPPAASAGMVEAEESDRLADGVVFQILASCLRSSTGTPPLRQSFTARRRLRNHGRSARG